MGKQTSPVNRRKRICGHFYHLPPLSRVSSLFVPTFISMDSVPGKRNCSQLPHPALFFRLLLMLMPFLLCLPTTHLASSCRSHPGGPFQQEAFSHLQLPVLPLITLTTLCYKCLFSCPFTPQDYKVLESKMFSDAYLVPSVIQ